MSQALAMDDEDDDVTESVANYPSHTYRSRLSAKQTFTIECLMNREPGESLASVSERAGIAERTIYRYLDNPHFQKAFRNRVKSDLSAHRPKVANALLQTALVPGLAGQTAAQKLYWQLIGDYKDILEVSGPDGNPISVQTSPALLSRLSLPLKRMIVEELEEIRRQDEIKAREGEEKRESTEDNREAIDVESQEVEPQVSEQKLLEAGDNNE